MNKVTTLIVAFLTISCGNGPTAPTPTPTVPTTTVTVPTPTPVLPIYRVRIFDLSATDYILVSGTVENLGEEIHGQWSIVGTYYNNSTKIGSKASRKYKGLIENGLEDFLNFSPSRHYTHYEFAVFMGSTEIECSEGCERMSR